MIRDLMLAITGSAGDANALSAATALAEHLDAHLSVVEPVDLPLPSPSPWGITPDAMLDQLHKELRDAAEARAAAWRAQLERSNARHDVRVAEALFERPPELLARQARHVDLSVLTAPRQSADDARGLVGAIFGSLLFESGRPVLVLPPHHPIELPVRHAVVAWQAKREATRALHDALPLLQQAGSVDLLMIDPDARETEHGDQPGVDVAAHLARHGMNVNVVVRPALRETVATVLLRHAAESRAQLLVAGGYGHSRLREWALGGTTRELLQQISLPILFSH